MTKKKSLLESNALYTLIAIIIGFLVGAILLIIAGISPFEAYGRLFYSVFSKPKNIIWAIIYATPLIFTGLSVAFSFRMGVFNIGAEGQFVVGSLAACLVGIFLKAPPVIHGILCLLAAALAGAAWSFIVGFLKIKRGINEVLSYIMFNWIAYYLSNYIVNIPGVKRIGGGEATKDVADSAMILMPAGIRSLLDSHSLNWGFLLAAVIAILIWFIMNKTTLGYQITAVGHNPDASRYAGISSNKITMIATSISGCLAGLGGAVHVLGMSGRISQFSGQEGFGFEGISVALIGASNPIGCVFSGLFYGIMKYGGSKLSFVNAPSEIVDIIMGTIILFIAISHVFKYVITKNLKKREVK